ncbi:MAG TPA: DUF288 domain-containing protein [Actinomycetes bacterium]|nr:DUF288 domain-containing protein [Actinomycetes bacterium]
MGADTQALVITTINPPTKAVAGFAAVDGWQVYVAGDLKTPSGWQHDGVDFIAADEQTSPLGRALPFNHYTRKMLGYVRAVERGATVIADSDDDNIPKPDWGFPAFEGSFAVTPDDAGHVNLYRSFTDQHIWPRGLPLDRVLAEDSVLTEQQLGQGDVRIGFWQGLADGDPDVDAVYRLTQGGPCTFGQRPPIVLGEGTLSPFNSQNTAVRSELFALLYLPATVTFRFTDILRGFVAQPVMWAAGYRLGFLEATVFQERNEHDFTKDFESEIPCYLQVRETVDVALAASSPDRSVEDNLVAVYDGLARHGIVQDAERGLLDAWLSELSRARTAGSAA